MLILESSGSKSITQTNHEGQEQDWEIHFHHQLTVREQWFLCDRCCQREQSSPIGLHVQGHWHMDLSCMTLITQQPLEWCVNACANIGNQCHVSGFIEKDETPNAPGNTDTGKHRSMGDNLPWIQNYWCFGGASGLVVQLICTV